LSVRCQGIRDDGGFDMDILATGAERVRALEIALGGEPPEDRRSAAELDRHIRQRFERRRMRRAEAMARLERQNTFIQELRERDPDQYRLLEGLAQASRRQSRVKPRRASEDKSHQLPELERVEPRIAVGSGFTLKVPPYDDQGQGIQGDGSADASPDALHGSYYLQTDTQCNSAGAWAGIAVNFFAITDNPFQRFAALVDYDYQWWEGADLFVGADNNGSTNIWVWGFTEQRWVLQQANVGPWWSADVNNSENDDDQLGRESLQVYFPAFGGNWYKVWFWSSLESDGSCFAWYEGTSENSISIKIPLVVFGSL
jgi:hypothetical protein